MSITIADLLSLAPVASALVVGAGTIAVVKSQVSGTQQGLRDAHSRLDQHDVRLDESARDRTALGVRMIAAEKDIAAGAGQRELILQDVGELKTGLASFRGEAGAQHIATKETLDRLCRNVEGIQRGMGDLMTGRRTQPVQFGGDDR